MNKVICLILTILMSASIAADAKGISKMFIHKSAGDETIFFIFPQKLPLCNCSPSKNDPISYDYTFVQKTGDVAMLISISIDQLIENLIVRTESNNTVSTYIPEIIYVKPKGKMFEYRLKISFPLGDFEKLYLSSTPFILSFEYKTKNSQISNSYCYSLKKWKENQSKMSQIINLIKINTGNP